MSAMLICGWSRRPTNRCMSVSAINVSVLTSITGWDSSRSICRRCVSVVRTLLNWQLLLSPISAAVKGEVTRGLRRLHYVCWANVTTRAMYAS